MDLRPAGAVLVLVLLTGTAGAQERDAAAIAAGMAVYKSQAGCEQCHGWMGTGGFHDALYDLAAGGPSLVDSKLTRAQMIDVLSCGRLTVNGVMPTYLNGAWTPAHPCDGKVAADVPYEQRPLPGPRFLTPKEIEDVVTYVQEVYQGKGITLEYCVKYFGANSHGCDLLR